MSVPAMVSDDFRLVFDAAPVSLWIEDYSGVKQLLADLRADGVTDIVAHLRAHPGVVDDALARIRVIDVNEATLGLYKATSKDQVVAGLGDIVRGRGPVFAHELTVMWTGDITIEIESVNYALDGTPLDILVRRSLLPGHEQRWDRVLVSIVDISERLRNERALSESESRALGLFEHSPVSLWLEDYSELRASLDALRASGVTDITQYMRDSPHAVEEMMRSIRVVDVNQRTVELFRARDKAELLSRLDEVFTDNVSPHFAREIEAMWRGDLGHERESLNYTLVGEAIDIHLEWSVLPGNETSWKRVLVSITDITARKRAETYMQYLGTHDSLTGLHNRMFYDETLARGVEEHPHTSVLIADLNGLKAANDMFGHAVGDGLIRRAGEVLRAAGHPDDVVARIGGDEFAILMPGQDAIGAGDLVKRLRRMIDVNNQFYQGPPLRMAIGVATAERNGALADAHRVADQRMYTDKGNDRRASSPRVAVA